MLSERLSSFRLSAYSVTLTQTGIFCLQHAHSDHENSLTRTAHVQPVTLFGTRAPTGRKDRCEQSVYMSKHSLASRHDNQQPSREIQTCPTVEKLVLNAEGFAGVPHIVSASCKSTKKV